MKLLAIDDNLDNLITLQALLKTFLPAAHLITSPSAADGIRRARAEGPDTILLDIQMPVMDGFQAARELKQHPATRHIPIILVTAHKSDAACRVKGLESGADAFLSKPIDESELVAQIKAMVRIKLAEDALRGERDALEGVVAERTAQLKRANERLTENLARLSESEERYARAVRGTSDGLWDLNLATGEVYLSPRWKELLGYRDGELSSVPESFYGRLHPDDLPRVRAAEQAHLRDRVPLDLEMRLRNREGTYLWFRTRGQAQWDERGEATRMAGSISDITERRQIEEQLRQSQKMEAVGQLAGGVAHDFNNILTVIAGYATILQMDLLEKKEQGEVIEQILTASERAAQLTRGLLAFSRKQAMAPRRTDLNEVVQRVEKFLVRIIGEDIALRCELHLEPLPVFVDTSQIEQVLVNLAANARDAMEGGGRFTIGTGMETVDDSLVRAQVCEKPGRYAVATLSDTGHGMDPETAQRIFEPFFTTKEMGKGTGLGLAIVYGIVQQHHGFIEVESSPGKGSVFKVYLPVADALPQAGDGLAAQAMPGTGTETILVAEDDAGVRNLVELVLTKFGYRVILAADGQEVIDQFTLHRGSVDLVLMDIIMPRKNGIEAIAEIRRLHPGVKVLFTSGYTADFVRSRGMEDGVELISKPVQPMELLLKIREMLGAG